jgi:eukaryotic-like serine/threonine-protein kinase
MTPDRWRRIQQLFEQALLLDPGIRSDWLARECGDDESLQAEVASLLASDTGANASFDVAVDQAISHSMRHIDAIEAGTVIGHYRVLRLIGRGGMGAVYLAERADQQFEQRVALKLIGTNLPGSTVAQRFRMERQILAQLNHPNIAHLLDGGTTQEGVPYLAMEYVEGTRIDEYCEQNQLDIAQRLALFQQVCSAVQYAHQHLVIHRDIKPSNILIGADGIPKLLDFGIAKLLAPTHAGTTGDLTRVHERVLTPEHASPEQVRGEPIGTVSDVYSLGVLLYQLLTGVPPYALRARTIRELEDLICTVETLRPSVAAQRNGKDETARALRRALSGDLDNIVMRAMHKDPQRRYSSAAALSDDIDNHRGHRPVQARPDSLGYRAGKFLRRNRLAVASAAAVMVLLFSVVAFFTVRLAHERDNAQLEARKAKQVVHFLTEIFSVADPHRSQGRQITAVEILDQGARDIEERLAQQPLVRAELLAAIGYSYKNLAEYDRAGPLLERSLALKSAAGLESTPEYGHALYELANLRRFQGKFDESEKLFRRTLELQQRIYPDGHEDTAATLTHLGTLYYEMNRPRESLELQEQALTMTRAVLGTEHDETADRLNNLALVLQDLDRHVEAERYLRECIELRIRLLGTRHPGALTSQYNLALLLGATGRYHEADAAFRNVLPLRRAVLGDSHPAVGFTLSAFGSLLTVTGRFEEAEKVLKEGREILTQKYGAVHWRTAAAVSRQGQLQLARGDYASARDLFDDALRSTTSVYGTDSEHAQTARTLLASALVGLGDEQQATQMVESSFAALRTSVGIDTIRVRHTLHALAGIRVRQNRLDEAAQLYGTELANYTRMGWPHSPDAAGARLGLAQVAALEGRHADAIGLIEQALTDLRAQLPQNHWRIAVGEVALGRSYLQARRADGATLIRRGSGILRSSLPANDPRVTAANGALQLLGSL